MGAKTYTHIRDRKTGKITVVEAKAAVPLIPFTKAPSKIARALWH